MAWSDSFGSGSLPSVSPVFARKLLAICHYSCRQFGTISRYILTELAQQWILLLICNQSAGTTQIASSYTKLNCFPSGDQSNCSVANSSEPGARGRPATP